MSEISDDEMEAAVGNNPWIALGLNPLKELLHALGFGTEQHAKDSLNRADDETIYRKTFRLMAPTFPHELFTWLRACGLPTDHAKQLMRDFAHMLGRLGADDEPPHSVDDSTTSR